MAKLRTKADEPAPDDVRTAVRDVICHCIYGVDKNPLAVDLCRVALWLAARLPQPNPALSPLVVPVAFFTILMGLFLIVSRKTALSQVLGYLVMENGIYAFGVGVVEGTPMLVELGVLLDLLVAVLVMGIVVFHIGREFDHIDTDQLTVLRDWDR